MRRHDSPGERRALTGADAPAPDADRQAAADRAGAGGEPADVTDGGDPGAERADTERADTDGAGADTSDGGRAAWPPRAGEPYRPWFTSAEPGEPWFTEDPGDPAG